MHEKLYIPQNMSLGLQNRPGETFTGKIGFLNPHDIKDRPKLKTGWEKWRDKKIPVPIIPNVPTEGFVINRNAGGKHSGWYWDHGREAKIRVWDPRDFEIEITIPNMLYLLEQTNSFKGKGIEGRLVYGWSGSTLMLIPEDSEEYRGSIEFTGLKSLKVASKELTPGATVLTKNEQILVYIGRWEVVKPDWSKNFSVANEHVFYNEKTKNFDYVKTAEVAKILDSDPSPKYSGLVEKFEAKDLGFSTRKLNILTSPKVKADRGEYRHTGRRGKLKPLKEIQISENTLFVKEGEIYKGYRVYQKDVPNMVTYVAGKSAFESQRGWKIEHWIVTNPIDLKIEDGVNKILAGKDKPVIIKDLKEINKKDLFYVATNIIGKKQRILG